MDARVYDDEAPRPEEERNAFLRLDPEGFQIRYPPPPHELDSYITPDSHLFHTMHMGAAVVESTRYQLVIDGLVERRVVLTLDQLKQLPQTSITAFHECYGSPLKPPVEAQWHIGNIHWTGVLLSHLLSLAGILVSDEEGHFVWSEGLDRGQFAGIKADRYQKDLPLQKAMRPEVLVAYAMNGEPLSKERGGPVRLVVPGYFGTNSTKWLSKLSVQKQRAPGPYTTKLYNEINPRDPDRKKMRPVWNVEVKSMITKPSQGEVLQSTDFSVQGWAWSDDGIGKVEVSWDKGETWNKAKVQPRSQYGWQRFDALLRLSPGSYTLLTKATSIDGEQQPLNGRRNHVHRVSVEVASN